jgi:periplasmic divalent cation tolerance protein
MTDKLVVLVTCKSLEQARRISLSLVQKRLAACANVLRMPIESVFRWDGKVEWAAEFLLLIKSTRKLLAAVEKEIKQLHSYEVPEVLALPVASGSAAYLAWMADATGARARKKAS